MNEQHRKIASGVLVVICILVFVVQLTSKPKPKALSGSNAAAEAVRKMNARAAGNEVARTVAVAAATGQLASQIVRPNAVTNVDTAAVRAHLQEWLRVPGRDPFGSWAGPAPRPVVVNTAPRLANLKLNAIYRQTGASYVVINNQILREGDSIDTLKVAKIEPDAVTLTGPAGWRRLELRRRSPVQPATNATAGRPDTVVARTGG